jgi:hypothetical protein
MNARKPSATLIHGAARLTQWRRAREASRARLVACGIGVAGGAARSIRLTMCIIALTAGCGKAPPVDTSRTSVSGVVNFAGQPLPAGTVNFEAAQGGMATSTKIGDGGHYSTDRAPVGSTRVSIDTGSVQYGNPAKYVAIPARYADTATSGLTVDIKPGSNENVNFDLTK